MRSAERREWSLRLIDSSVAFDLSAVEGRCSATVRSENVDDRFAFRTIFPPTRCQMSGGFSALEAMRSHIKARSGCNEYLDCAGCPSKITSRQKQPWLRPYILSTQPSFLSAGVTITANSSKTISFRHLLGPSSHFVKPLARLHGSNSIRFALISTKIDTTFRYKDTGSGYICSEDHRGHGQEQTKQR